MIRFDVDVQERLFFQEFLSLKQSGNRLEMTLVYNLMKQVEFSPMEIENYEIKMKGNTIQSSSNFQKEIEVSDEQMEILLHCISIANDNNQIYLPMIPLLNRIDTLNKQ